MSVDVDKLIKLGRAEIGYSESPAGSNKTKYGQEYGTNGVSWCAIFQWYLFKKVGYSKYFYGGEKIASCTSLIEYYQKNYPSLVITKDFKRGDLILFNFDQDTYPDHIGLCSEVIDSTTIKTIEGNTGTLSQDNGGKVMEKTRKNSLVKCGIRWWMIDEINNTKNTILANKSVVKLNIELEMLQLGSQGQQVKALQILLNGMGSSCGMSDAIFGSKTEFAVKNFQKKNGLEDDGVVGLKTWNKLLKGE